MSTGTVVGAVLTGGASRRMGRDKARLEVDGVAMASRVAAALREGGCDPVFALGGDEVGLGALGFEVVPDGWPGEGPLGAIVTALAHVSTLRPGASTFVAACDLPFLDPATVRDLVAAAMSSLATPSASDVVVAASTGVQPLCAVWSPGAAGGLRSTFEAGERSVMRALASLRVTTHTVDASALRNVNAPEDVPHYPA